jgi:hypothetical protein
MNPADGAVDVSPAPWPLVLVLVVGAFSALAWGLATFLRPRPTAPRSEDDEDRRLDEATLEEPRPEDR